MHMPLEKAIVTMNDQGKSAEIQISDIYWHEILDVKWLGYMIWAIVFFQKVLAIF